MNYLQIKALQKKFGYSEIQRLIDTGTAWNMEGSCGRYAMQCIESGSCMLPLQSFRDFWGNYIPSRKQVKEGTKGSYLNTVNYYTNIPDSYEVEYNEQTRENDE